MPRNSIEERAKILYKYIKTKEGELPDMEDKKTQEALQYLFSNGYLIREKCCSPQTTSKGEKWYCSFS
jgi:hypothetical protein